MELVAFHPLGQVDGGFDGDAGVVLEDPGHVAHRGVLQDRVQHPPAVLGEVGVVYAVRVSVGHDSTADLGALGLVEAKDGDLGPVGLSGDGVAAHLLALILF